jgi:hypothetical protein
MGLLARNTKAARPPTRTINATNIAGRIRIVMTAPCSRDHHLSRKLIGCGEAPTRDACGRDHQAARFIRRASVITSFAMPGRITSLVPPKSTCAIAASTSLSMASCSDRVGFGWFSER